MDTNEQGQVTERAEMTEAPPKPKEIFAVFAKIHDKTELVGVASNPRKAFELVKDCILHGRCMIFFDPAIPRPSQIRALRFEQRKRRDPEIINRHLYFGVVQRVLDTQNVCTRERDGKLFATGEVAVACRKAVQDICRPDGARLEDYGEVLK